MRKHHQSNASPTMEWTSASVRTIRPAWLVLLCLVLLSSDWIIEAAPASPWNQPGLNLIFKPDLTRSSSRLKNNQRKDITAAAVKSSDSSSKTSTSNPESSKRLRKFPSHSWGYTRYGKDIGHIRHIASRNKENLPSNLSVPCPRDYVKLFNGKCRRVPKFSSSRVG